MQPVRWGILSTARINELVLAGARASRAGRGARRREPRPRARREAYAREHGIERAHGSYEALLADPEIEAVYISLPNSLHVEWTIRALEAGKHVLCEKPLSRRRGRRRSAAFDVAERCGRLLMEAFMYRHNPQTARLVELVAEGAIGAPAAGPRELQLHARRRRQRAAARRARGRRADGRRLLLRQRARGCCAGEPRARGGRAACSAATGSTSCSPASMRFADEVLAHFDCGLVLGPRDELEVVGEDGQRCSSPTRGTAARPVIELRRAGERRSGSRSPAADSYGLEAREPLARRSAARPRRCSGAQDAVGQARAIEALYRSADTGQPVAL